MTKTKEFMETLLIEHYRRDTWHDLDVAYIPWERRFTRSQISVENGSTVTILYIT